MKTVGAYEAKTHLSRLLDEAAAGETIVITKHGVPVAKLVPPDGMTRQEVDAIIERFRELRKRTEPLGDLSIRELIDEGRRF